MVDELLAAGGGTHGILYLVINGKYKVKGFSEQDRAL